MPDFLEAELRAEGIKKGLIGKNLENYIYGAMNNMGVMHGNKETAKGKAMSRKHAADTKKKKARRYVA